MQVRDSQLTGKAFFFSCWMRECYSQWGFSYNLGIPAMGGLENSIDCFRQNIRLRGTHRLILCLMSQFPFFAWSSVCWASTWFGNSWPLCRVSWLDLISFQRTGKTLFSWSVSYPQQVTHSSQQAAHQSRRWRHKAAAGPGSGEAKISLTLVHSPLQSRKLCWH